jgi:hypothetical protein
MMLRLVRRSKLAVAIFAASTAIMIALLPDSGRAQFVVYDPTNYIQALARYAQLVQQYRFWVAQARRLPVDLASRYRLAPVRWQTHDVARIYTYAEPILSALNIGDPTGVLYDVSTDQLDPLDDLVSSVPPDLRPRLRLSYGAIQFEDSVAKTAIDQVGTTRTNGSFALSTIQAMEDDAVSSVDDFHTQTALLNKINGAGVLALRLDETASQLQMHILEQLLVQNKRSRDAEAELMDAHLFQWRYGAAYGHDLFSHSAAELDSWRLR